MVSKCLFSRIRDLSHLRGFGIKCIWWSFKMFCTIKDNFGIIVNIPNGRAFRGKDHVHFFIGLCDDHLLCKCQRPAMLLPRVYSLDYWWHNQSPLTTLEELYLCAAVNALWVFKAKLFLKAWPLTVLAHRALHQLYRRALRLQPLGKSLRDPQQLELEWWCCC